MAWFSYTKAWHEVEELLDGQLALSVRLIEAQMRHETLQHNRIGTVPLVEILDLNLAKLHPYEQTLAFQVRDYAGNLLMQSANAHEMQPQSRPGFFDTVLAGATWRVLAAISQDGKLRIQVAHPANRRHEIGLEVSNHLAWPLLFALPLLLLLVFWSVHSTFKPLGRLAREIRVRSADQLAPVPTAGVIAEVFPLIEAFNRLLTKVQASIEGERQLTANAAHELRTPLAALKIHAQVAAASIDDVQRDHALVQVLHGIGRAERLVEQMLRLARLDAGQADLQIEPLDIPALLGETADLASSVAQARDQRLKVVVELSAIIVSGDHDLLLAALRNLVDNACRYSRAGDEIMLGAKSLPEGWCLYVRDHGPGVAEHELAGLTQRFRRGHDVTSEGTGLGLAIVERIAALHGASLQLTNESEGGTGLSAMMIFAVPPAPSI